MSDTLPIDLNSAALGIGRHVSGIADPFTAVSTSSASRSSSVPMARDPEGGFADLMPANADGACR
jgi:hypothetical protein